MSGGYGERDFEVVEDSTFTPVGYQTPNQRPRVSITTKTTVRGGDGRMMTYQTPNRVRGVVRSLTPPGSPIMKSTPVPVTGRYGYTLDEVRERTASPSRASNYEQKLQSLRADSEASETSTAKPSNNDTMESLRQKISKREQDVLYSISLGKAILEDLATVKNERDGIIQNICSTFERTTDEFLFHAEDMINSKTILFENTMETNRINYKTQLTELKGEIQSLEEARNVNCAAETEQLDQLTDALRSMRSEAVNSTAVTSLEVTNKQLESDLRVLTKRSDQLDSIRHENNRLVSQLKLTESRLEATRLQNSDKETVNQLLADIKEYQRRLNESNEKRQQLQHQVSNSQNLTNQNKDFQSQINTLENSLKTAVDSERTLQQQHLRLRSELSAFQGQDVVLRDGCDSVTSNLQSKIKDIDALRSRVDSLEQNLRDAKSEIFSLTTDNKTLKDRCSLFQTELRSRKDDQQRQAEITLRRTEQDSTREKQLQQLTEDKQRLSALCESTSAEGRRDKQQLLIRVREMESLRRDQQMLSSKMSESKRESDELRDDKKRLLVKTTDLTKALLTLREEHKRLSDHHNEKESTVALLKKECSDLRDDKKRLITRHAETEKLKLEKQHQDQSLKDLREDKKRLLKRAADTERLKTELDTSESELKSLREDKKRLLAKNTEGEKLEREVKVLREDKKQLLEKSNEGEKYRTAHTQLENEMSTLREEATTTEEKLKSERELLTTECTDLRTQLQTLSEQIKELQSENEVLTEKVAEHSKHDIAVLNMKISSLSQDNKDLRDELNSEEPTTNPLLEICEDLNIITPQDYNQQSLIKLIKEHSNKTPSTVLKEVCVDLGIDESDSAIKDKLLSSGAHLHQLCEDLGIMCSTSDSQDKLTSAIKDKFYSDVSNPMSSAAPLHQLCEDLGILISNTESETAIVSAIKDKFYSPNSSSSVSDVSPLHQLCEDLGILVASSDQQSTLLSVIKDKFYSSSISTSVPKTTTPLRDLCDDLSIVVSDADSESQLLSAVKDKFYSSNISTSSSSSVTALMKQLCEDLGIMTSRTDSDSKLASAVKDKFYSSGIPASSTSETAPMRQLCEDLGIMTSSTDSESMLASAVKDKFYSSNISTSSSSSVTALMKQLCEDLGIMTSSNDSDSKLASAVKDKFYSSGIPASSTSETAPMRQLCEDLGIMTSSNDSDSKLASAVKDKFYSSGIPDSLSSETAAVPMRQLCEDLNILVSSTDTPAVLSAAIKDKLYQLERSQPSVLLQVCEDIGILASSSDSESSLATMIKEKFYSEIPTPVLSTLSNIDHSKPTHLRQLCEHFNISITDTDTADELSMMLMKRFSENNSSLLRRLCLTTEIPVTVQDSDEILLSRIEDCVLKNKSSSSDSIESELRTLCDHLSIATTSSDGCVDLIQMVTARIRDRSFSHVSSELRNLCDELGIPSTDNYTSFDMCEAIQLKLRTQPAVSTGLSELRDLCSHFNVISTSQDSPAALAHLIKSHSQPQHISEVPQLQNLCSQLSIITTSQDGADELSSMIKNKITTTETTNLKKLCSKIGLLPTTQDTVESLCSLIEDKFNSGSEVFSKLILEMCKILNVATDGQETDLMENCIEKVKETKHNRKASEILEMLADDFKIPTETEDAEHFSICMRSQIEKEVCTPLLLLCSCFGFTPSDTAGSQEISSQLLSLLKSTKLDLLRLCNDLGVVSCTVGDSFSKLVQVVKVSSMKQLKTLCETLGLPSGDRTPTDTAKLIQQSYANRGVLGLQKLCSSLNFAQPEYKSEDTFISNITSGFNKVIISEFQDLCTQLGIAFSSTDTTEVLKNIIIHQQSLYGNDTLSEILQESGIQLPINTSDLKLYVTGLLSSSVEPRNNLNDLCKSFDIKISENDSDATLKDLIKNEYFKGTSKTLSDLCKSVGLNPGIDPREVVIDKLRCKSEISNLQQLSSDVGILKDMTEIERSNPSTLTRRIRQAIQRNNIQDIVSVFNLDANILSTDLPTAITKAVISSLSSQIGFSGTLSEKEFVSTVIEKTSNRQPDNTTHYKRLLVQLCAHLGISASERDSVELIIELVKGNIDSKQNRDPLPLMPSFIDETLPPQTSKFIGQLDDVELAIIEDMDEDEEGLEITEIDQNTFSVHPGYGSVTIENSFDVDIPQVRMTPPPPLRSPAVPSSWNQGSSHRVDPLSSTVSISPQRPRPVAHVTSPHAKQLLDEQRSHQIKREAGMKRVSDLLGLRA